MNPMKNHELVEEIVLASRHMRSSSTNQLLRYLSRDLSTAQWKLGVFSALYWQMYELEQD
jgi:hypothetical protein